MLAHDVRHVVVCPGSRNAPLVNDFYQLAARGDMHVYPVTDERSAAFVAIGLYLAKHQPAAVCVTSGSALLNTLPAVAEAYYRHAQLLVISADRPAHDIGQLKGQTIPQQGALQPYTQTWQLPEAGGAACEALCNEALLSLRKGGGRPAHVNVPLSEPLHIYNKEQLSRHPGRGMGTAASVCPIPQETMRLIAEASLPALFVGQMDFPPEELLHRLDRKRSILVLSEAIGSSVTQTMEGYHQVLRASEEYLPDVIVHIGGAGIDKDYGWLVRNEKAVVVRIEEDEEAAPDTFGRLKTIVRGDTTNALRQLLKLLPKPSIETFHSVLAESRAFNDRKGIYDSDNDFPGIPTKWAQHIDALLNVVRGQSAAIHVGNSSVLRYFRLGHRMPPHLFCNRGVNGIDGSLSVAAGHSLASSENVYCILGDLSFFYDSNALWNGKLRGNLRILLLNDHGGDIFSRVQGLEATPALPIIAGRHAATAEGICRSYGADYIGVGNAFPQNDTLSHETLPDKVVEQLTAPPEARKRPLVVESFR